MYTVNCTDCQILRKSMGSCHCWLPEPFAYTRDERPKYDVYRDSVARLSSGRSHPSGAPVPCTEWSRPLACWECTFGVVWTERNFHDEGMIRGDGNGMINKDIMRLQRNKPSIVERPGSNMARIDDQFTESTETQGRDSQESGKVFGREQ